MSKKSGILVTILSIAAMAVAIVAIVLVCLPAGDGEMDSVQYLIYLGTNDMDTNEPVASPEVIRARVEEILIDRFDGYTIQEADGGWVDGETAYQEYTLVITLSNTNLDRVHAAADELLKAFHQKSVLIQMDRTATEFYWGADG